MYIPSFNNLNSLSARGRVVKNKFIMKISYFTKEEENLILTDSKILYCRGKEFQESLIEDEAKGIEHKIEIVDREPEKFVFGVLYVLRTGTKVWTYQLN